MNRRRFYAHFAICGLLIASLALKRLEFLTVPGQSDTALLGAWVMLIAGGIFLTLLTIAFLVARKELMARANEEALKQEAPIETAAEVTSWKRLALDLGLPLSFTLCFLSQMPECSLLTRPENRLLMAVSVAGVIAGGVYLYEILRDYRLARREMPDA